MQWTGLNELREKFLSFYESKGHLRLPSFSLIPQNDKSLLLINSGMAPMKKFFTGEVTPPRTRVTTCQKCIRTPDIERVGKTARHGTYFEMLGNFSFGDYFKHEATAWAWEFCTKVLELPIDRIWISIYENDDQAFDIWTKEVGVAPDHIVRLGKEDNFWEHGTGPCGPCSELYFDRGEKYGCGSPTCGVGCDCDRYVEFWNLVFTQFDSDGKGNYANLAKPNIDTGMGLERLACIMQGVGNLFEVDTVQNIMKHISRIAKVSYGDNEKADVSLRVITDHIRSSTFMLGDGVLPSNEGRGYVLRRLIRRAARHGRLLGIREPFLAEVCETVIHENGQAYPELAEKKTLIQKVISIEEESFGRTIDQGLSLLQESIDTMQGDTLSGDEAFRLYDTYGFPLDLTRDILEEQGKKVDEDRFNECMTEQRVRARTSRKATDGEAWAAERSLLDELEPTKFVGYECNEVKAKVLAAAGEEGILDLLNVGDSAAVVLDTTPFYAESGGQVGDTGTITSGDAVFEVTDTIKLASGVIVHRGRLAAGEWSVGGEVTARIDVERRAAIRRNHTAAHLLQAALRQVLGKHVEQAGQLVNDQAMRFDFTHFSALTPEELAAVEAKVNGVILSAIEVENREMPLNQAKEMGAMALFGEKYGEIVRIVRAGDFSLELCGGTHVDNTAKLGLFKIVSESSVAAGVRRIEAVTGAGVLEYVAHSRELLSRTAGALKAGNIEDLPARAAQLVAEGKEKDREIVALNGQIAEMRIDGLMNCAVDVSGVCVVSTLLDGAGAEALRTLAGKMRDRREDIVAVVAGAADGKGTIAVSCGKQAMEKGAHAGNIARAVAKLAGGSGGGRPDNAMAGAKELDKLGEAVAAAAKVVAEMIG